MFTGIVDHCGKIKRFEKKGEVIELQIECGFKDFAMGESIAVDGVCLTVMGIEPWGFRCEVSPETVSKSIAGDYQEGDVVNLERSLRMGDRLGGHFVMGHVDRTAEVALRETVGEFVRMTFEGFPLSQMRYLVPKGSVGLNGVSLTLNEVWDGGFEVMLIPHTLEITNLSHWKAGTRINIEFDWLTKTILHDVQLTHRLLEERNG